MVTPLLGWVVAALVAGLWWGERGRRRAAERWVGVGRPGAGAPAGRLPRVPSTGERLTQGGASGGAADAAPSDGIGGLMASASAARLTDWIATRLRARGQPDGDAAAVAAELLRRARDG